MQLSNRERFLRLMRGQAVDRAPFFPCFGPWPQTLARWHSEGLSEGADYREVVGFDGDLRHRLPINAFLCPQFERRVLAQSGDVSLVRDRRGVVRRERNDGYALEFVSHPVTDRESWKRIVWRLQPNTEQRFPDDWAAFCRAHAERRDPSYAGDLPVGFYGGPRELLGFRRLTYLYYDDPAFLEGILDTLCDLWIAVYQRAFGDARPDFFFVWEDMCYKGGPLISPGLFRRFLLPRYKRLTGAVRESGVDLIMVDSDGDPRALIPLWREGGVNILFPLETQMGLDICELRRQHPTLGMIGGINKYALALGRDAIDEELRKVPSMLESGRYLPAVDHSVPPDVSWDDYRYFCERLRELIERYPPAPAL
jgi:uroporphyrinogen decarboxylase